MPKYILIYPEPPLIPEDSDAIAEPVVDPDDANAIASGDVTTAKWIVENPAGKAVRMTTGDLIAHVTAGSLSIPTFAVSTAYPRLGAFVHEGVLYRVLRAIPSTNSAEVDALLGGGAIEALGSTDSFSVPTFAVRTAYDRLSLFVFDGVLYRVLQAIPANNAGDVSTLLATGAVEALGGAAGQDVNFVVLNWRDGNPRPPFKSQVDAFNKGLLTIGIGQDGVLWTLKDTPAADAEGVWIDFDTNEWQFEQNDVLPNSALQTGDYYYRYDDDVWVLYDGTQQIVYYDRDISVFLPNHIFLGQFANADNATQSIVGYDGTKTYLAYFTVTVSGRTGREVRQLQSYTPGRQEGITWVSTDEPLHHLSDELHKLIQTNVTNIVRNKSLIGEEGINIRNNARSIMDLETEQDTQDTLIQRNADNIPEPVTDDHALGGSAREGYLTSRQVRLNVLAAYVKEVSDDPELDTINRRYAVLGYDQTAYNADNLEFGQMMFNNATITSATKVKIGYVDEGKPTQLFGGLDSNSKIELWGINSPHDYEEPFNTYESEITEVVNTVRSAANAISTIELTLSTPPSLTVGTGPNTSYILAVSGKFKGRLVPAAGLPTAPAQRSERININAQTGIRTTEVDLTTTTVANVYGSGTPEILSAEPTGANFTVLKAGIYMVRLDGTINIKSESQGRAKAVFTLYDSSDMPLGSLTDRYHRAQNSNNRRLSAATFIEIPNDNTVIAIKSMNEIPNGATFDLNATSIVFGRL